MNSSSARQHGIHFNGATYKCIRADKGSIYAKKVNISDITTEKISDYCVLTCIQEDSGFIAVSTNKLIVYGSYSSTMNPSVCVEAVERLGKFVIQTENLMIKQDTIQQVNI